MTPALSTLTNISDELTFLCRKSRSELDDPCFEHTKRDSDDNGIGGEFSVILRPNYTPAWKQTG